MNHTLNSATAVTGLPARVCRLDSIVYRFLEGLSPESIATDCFPVLTLEEVYGAITCYLAHRAEVDAYLQEVDEDYAAFRNRVRTEYPKAHRPNR